jgi:hypothetical protein
MRYRKIKTFVEDVLQPSVQFIKRSRKRSNMPFKEMKQILDVFFPKTRDVPSGNGFFKHVFIIHFQKRKLALKVGRNKKDIRKDHTTYTRLSRRLGTKSATRHFAKVYWATGLFMLQKYGHRVDVPKKQIDRLKEFGRKNGLRDVREANIMKVGRSFKIIDAERR